MNTIVTEDAVADLTSRLETSAGRDDDLEAWLLRVAAAQLPDLAVRIANEALPK